MKKARKKILGFVGLVLVVAMTVLAIMLPGAETSALETNPVTDEVKVRVVGSTPLISLIYPEDSSVLVDPAQHFQFEYENIETTTTEIYYTDPEGAEHIYTIDTVDPNFYPGTSEEYPLDLSGTGYGYGSYKITARGIGYDGVTSEDTISFSYYPVYGEIIDDSGGTFNLGLFYNADNEDLASILVNVYDANGNLVTALSPKTINLPGTEVDLDFAKNNLPFGAYTVEIIGLDSEGDELSVPYTLDLNYEEDKKEDSEDSENGSNDNATGAPDTGYFWGGTNITGVDFATTGLIAFSATVVLAVVLVVRNKREKTASNV